jgi:hypothetical protein
MSGVTDDMFDGAVVGALRYVLWVALVIALFPVTSVHAQWNLALQRAGADQVYVTGGLDPAVITSVGYGRTVSAFGVVTQLSAEAGVVAGEADLRDFRTRVTAQVQLARVGRVRIGGRASFITRGTENRIFRAVNMGAALSGTAGLYGQRWFAAGEVGFDKALVTHLRHSDEYRALHFATAQDGWYLDNGGTWGLGALMGRTLGRHELVVRVGVSRTQAWDTPSIPGYAVIGWGVSF